MMARSITVERSGTALFGLARVSGLGMGMGMGTFIRASEVNLEEKCAHAQTGNSS